MTRTAIQISEGAFTNPPQPASALVAGLRLPSRVHLVGEYVLGGTEALSIRNRADPTNPLVVQGAGHIYNANSVTVRPSLTTGFGFLTNFQPDEHSSLIVVQKKATTAGTPTFSVGYNGSSAIWGFRPFGTAYHFLGFDNLANGGAIRPAASIPAGLFFEAGVSSILNPQWATGGKAKHYWYEAGVQMSSETATATATQAVRRAQATHPNRIAIGSNQLTDSITTNSVEVAFVGIYQRPLSAAEIDAAYLAIKAYYAALGVTVS